MGAKNSLGYTFRVNGPVLSNGAWTHADAKDMAQTSLAGNIAATSIIKRLNLKRWTWSAGAGAGGAGADTHGGRRTGLGLGFVAQEVQKVAPELVHIGEDGSQAVSYERLSAVLAASVKELITSLDTTTSVADAAKSAAAAAKQHSAELHTTVGSLGAENARLRETVQDFAGANIRLEATVASMERRLAKLEQLLV